MMALTSGNVFIIFSLSFGLVYSSLVIYSSLSKKKREMHCKNNNYYRGQVVFGLGGFFSLQSNVQLSSYAHELNNNRKELKSNILHEDNIYFAQPSGVVQIQEYKENFVL